LVFPVLVALLLTDIALAVLGKVAPQFGIFSIGMQLKVGVALGALVITLPLLMPRLHQLFTGVSAVSVAILK
ncbi:MAG TPA: flagellar biosynthetic protein FliR, partial [Chloroflexota bacterium]